MIKTPPPQNQKYLCAEAEATMASALDWIHAEINEIVGSASTTLRDAFTNDILGRVAKDLRVLTASSSDRWQKSFGIVWHRHGISETMARKYAAPKLVGSNHELKAAKVRAQDPQCLDEDKFMSLLWDLGDSVFEYHGGNRERSTMMKLVVWARIAAHLRPQSRMAKASPRLVFRMATEKDYAKLAMKLKMILGVEPQSWASANEQFIVIHVTDASRTNAVAV